MRNFVENHTPGRRCEKFQLDFGYLYAKARPLGELARRYLDLLKEEMAFLDEDAPEEPPARV